MAFFIPLQGYVKKGDTNLNCKSWLTTIKTCSIINT